MPFTEWESRIMALQGITKAVGDKCFLAYRPLKLDWDKEPRWTTAHNQFKTMFNLSDDEAAKQLAWWVHFVLNVIPYEIKKRDQNGDVN